MRRAGVALLAVLVAAAGAAGIVAFLQSRDSAGIGDPARGRAASPAEVPRGVAGGNVVLVAPDAAPLAGLRDEYAGPPGTPAVRVQRSARLGPGVHAFAAGRRLDVASPEDPELRAFIEYYLGRSSP